MTRRWAVVLALVLGASSCAPRGLPSRLPSASVASAEGPSAAPARVTVALDEEPPLPGEPLEDWEGLRRPAGEEAGAHHHHGEHR